MEMKRYYKSNEPNMGVCINAFETYHVTVDGRHMRYMNFMFPYKGDVVKCIMKHDIFHARYTLYTEEAQAKIQARKEAHKAEVKAQVQVRAANNVLVRMGLEPSAGLSEAVKSI